MSNSELTSKLKRIEDFSRRFPSEEFCSIVVRAKEAFQNYTNELSAGNSTKAEKNIEEINQLESEALLLVVAHVSKKSEPSKIRTVAGQGMLALVFLAIMWFIYQYSGQIGFDTFSTIKGTRPILVVAIIVSTIVFGGSLLIGSLFSSDAPFEDRFKHAREVFLVFSGIFGTVIGFYFGAGIEGKNSQNTTESTSQQEAVAKVDHDILAIEGIENTSNE